MSLSKAVAMSRISRLIVFVILLGLPAFLSAQSSPSKSDWKSVVCQQRRTCETTLHPAGKAPSGDSLTVVEATFDAEDKPKDAPAEGCSSGSDTFDGGTECWLLEGQKQPRQLLKWCDVAPPPPSGFNHEFKFGNNSLTYTFWGGSNDRWGYDQTIQLSPPLMTTFEAQTWESAGAVSAKTHADVAAMTVKYERTDTDHPENDLAGFALPVPREKPESKSSVTPLANCAMQVGPDHLEDFLVYGAIDPQRRPELRLLALSDARLLIQVYDPKPSLAGNTWVNADHVEVWTKLNGQLVQIGIGVDGVVYSGIGHPASPKVLRSQVRDERDRPVVLLDVEWIGAGGGMAVVYSQAENGKQARMFSTTGFKKYRPSSIIHNFEVPVACDVKDGRWSIISNPGTLEADPDSLGLQLGPL